jgi:RNA polymerase sigma-70 factor (ECF subfamily)
MPTTVEEPTVQPDLESLEQIFVAHHDRVFRAAYRITGNASDAEDVAQTVFLRLLRNRPDFAAVEDAGNYLYKAGINAALDLIRSRRSSVPLEEAISSDASSGWSPDRSHHAPELRERILAAVSDLHPTAAEMFTLRYFEGLDTSEVAKAMDTSEGTVAVTLHRTRARLQKDIGAYLGAVR